MNTQNQFSVLLLQNKGIIYSAISKYCEGADLKEDLFQEISLRAWKSYERFRGDSQFSTWLYNVARNTCIDTLRRTSSRVKTVALDNMFFEIVDEAYEEIPMPVVDSLSKIERLTLDLFIDGKSYKEIAKQTGESANKIAVRMFRIKERLRKSIAYDKDEIIS